MSAPYRWKITRDLIDPGVEGNAVGIEGPRDASDDVTSNPKRFSIYDEDGECYGIGMIYGDYDGFEPLDDFGRGYWGATEIRYGGKAL